MVLYDIQTVLCSSYAMNESFSWYFYAHQLVGSIWVWVRPKFIHWRYYDIIAIHKEYLGSREEGRFHSDNIHFFALMNIV